MLTVHCQGKIHKKLIDLPIIESLDLRLKSLIIIIIIM